MPGIRLQLRAAANNVEKIFTVSAGANPGDIRIAVTGADALHADENGALMAITGNGPVVFTRPVAWQDGAAGQRIDVDVRYAIDDGTSTYRFALGQYDRNRPLMIDPLLKSTYHGGNGDDGIAAMAIHPINGDVYVAGVSSSSDLPGITGGAQNANNGGYEAFVARLSPDLQTRVQTTYYGGTGFDTAIAMTIGPGNGNVYIAGYTGSGDLPGAAGSPQSSHAGGETDGFVAAFTASLTSLIRATYAGGTKGDRLSAVAVDRASGDVFVGGYAFSSDVPGTAGGASPNGFQDLNGLIIRYSPDLATRRQATYHGSRSHVTALAVHPLNGDLYAGGHAQGPVGGVAGGAMEVRGNSLANPDYSYVTRFNPALTSIIQSTYYGHADVASNQGMDTRLAALAIHPETGLVYVGGFSASTDFPKVSGAEHR